MPKKANWRSQSAVKARAGKPSSGYTIPPDLKAAGFREASIPSRKHGIVQSPGGTKRVANTDKWRARTASISSAVEPTPTWKSPEPSRPKRLRISPGGEAMLAAVQAAGLKTLLVSGGFTFFTERLQQRLGLDYAHANVLEIEDGRLTGRVVGGIVDAEEKRRTVERVCAELGIEPRQAIVMGDGANDLRMMGIAGLSVAFRAKPVVRAQADVALNFSGLDGVLTVLA